MTEATDAVTLSTDERAVIFNTPRLNPGTARSTERVNAVTLNSNAEVDRAFVLSESGLVDVSRYRTQDPPGMGKKLKPEDRAEVQTDDLE